ncbi:MAG: hypothetical protein IKU90_04440 [Clostridia bacterium]|nr:hypothetical protein [Clostridia bacterium]
MENMVVRVAGEERCDVASPVLTDADAAMASELLSRYRMGKTRLDSRICEEAAWWRARHGGQPAGDTRRGRPPVSAWLWGSVCNKHADFCDARPICLALPREPDDEAEATLLSDVLPVIAERCRFEQTYSDNVWSKLKHGMAAYGVFWNSTLENGVGDVDIRRVDILNLFWEPGVRDIQESPNLFLVGLEDTEALLAKYPHLKEARGTWREDGAGFTPDVGGSFVSGNEGMGDKTAVVDWYYKRITPEGKTLLHYAKFSGDVLLYASENDPKLRQRGWYDHGMYPIVIDVLFPEEGTPEGYGLIAVGRNPQGYIDELDGHLLEYANTASRVRYWAKRSLGINEREFLDPDRRIIEVEGDIDEEKLRQITLAPMDGMLTDVRRMKIDELKETTGNRDVSQGSASGGVVAASAIAALQEAGNKGSRDMVAGTYRAYVQIMQQVIELIRQFYDGVRVFRIVGEDGGRRYVRYSNRGLQDRPTGVGTDGFSLYRRPVFDIEVRAERKTPSDRSQRNQLMLELFRAGLFDPANREIADRMLSGMDFEGVELLRAILRRGTSEDGA